MKLSTNQQAALRELHRNPSGTRYGWGSSCTNSTMSALERRGLVKVEFDHSKRFVHSRWVITEAGTQLAEKSS